MSGSWEEVVKEAEGADMREQIEDLQGQIEDLRFEVNRLKDQEAGE